MKIESLNNYIEEHYLINRIYDTLFFFNFFDNAIYCDSEKIKKKLEVRIRNSLFIENLLCYLESKLKLYYDKIEIRVNLMHLIYDLNFLKQIVDK